jgi:Prokaryotic N-terminal methylation motif
MYKSKTINQGLNKKVSAFTFVELMIASLIMMFLVAAVISVLTVGDKILSRDMGLVELQQKNRGVLHAISRELRQSDSTAITLNSATDIDFTIVDEITNPSVPVTYYVRYYLDGGNQLIRENPSTGTACDSTWSDAKCSIIVADVDTLDFCCIGGASCSDCSNAHTVQIEVGVNKSVRGNALPAMPFMKRVKLRNE